MIIDRISFYSSDKNLQTKQVPRKLDRNDRFSDKTLIKDQGKQTN